jgi:hypothetical protein
MLTLLTSWLTKLLVEDPVRHGAFLVARGTRWTFAAAGAATLAVLGCGPIVVNSGQTGYYRTLYAPALLDRLTASFARLKPIDQIGLLADNWGLGLAGYQSAAEALDLVDAVPADANPQVWARAATILKSVHGLYEGDPAHQAMLGRYASAKLSPVLARIGWTARAGEAPTIPVLRADLIETLGEMGDEKVVAEANRLLAAGDPRAALYRFANAFVSFARSADRAIDRAAAAGGAAPAFLAAMWRSRSPGGGGSTDPAMVAKLEDYAKRYLTPQSRGRVDVAIASIRDRVRVRTTRLPDITKWLERKAI